MQIRNPGRRIAAVFSVTLLLATGCRSSGVQTSYDESVETNYRNGCELALEDANDVETIQAGAEQVCSCAYDQIEATIPFEDFKILDDRLKENLSLLQETELTPGSTEARVVEIISTCIREG